MKKLLVFCFSITMLLLTTTGFAEIQKEYPNGFYWHNLNTPYILSEYDKLASKPGSLEWLERASYDTNMSKSGSSSHQRIYHHIPDLSVLIPGAVDANWVVEFDYKKPVPGAIAYHDNKGAAQFHYSFNLIRAVSENTVTIEWMENDGSIHQRKVNISDMEFFGEKKFHGYIYPWKIGKQPH